MKLTTPTTENSLIDQNNEIRAKHQKLGSKLKDLTDQELFIWIAGNTLDYGRSFNSSIENALYHMEDRKHAEELMGKKNTGN